MDHDAVMNFLMQNETISEEINRNPDPWEQLEVCGPNIHMIVHEESDALKALFKINDYELRDTFVTYIQNRLD